MAQRATPLTRIETVYTDDMKRKDIAALICSVIVSLITVVDLFFHSGRPITFDGHIHMTTMAQFAQALKDGEFPVRWSNGFAQFGLPLPLFAHQLPAYAGALLIMSGLSVTTSYNLVLTATILLGSIILYVYVRTWVDTDAALAASIVATFFPYKIINMYIRGALPELLSASFFPLLLYGIDQITRGKYLRGSLWIGIGTLCIALSHPMLLLILGLTAAVYAAARLYPFKDIQALVYTASGVVFGIAGAAYYLIPLVIEMKYFYQGVQPAQALSSDVFLSWKNFFDPHWYYYLTHPGPRGNLLKVGIPELVLLLIATALLFFKKQKKESGIQKLHGIWWGIAVVALYMTLPLSKPLYSLIPGLSLVQYPWRFLIVVQVAVAVLTAVLVQRFFSSRKTLLVVLLSTLCIIRIPQLYGKNYAAFPESQYFHTISNLHSQNLNTIWSDNSEKYPPKTQQAAVLSGEAILLPTSLKNARRTYTINAAQPARLIDYTFYFPGWKVFVDGTEIPIEFQDMNYRGLITYQVPAGSHQISVVYTQTKVRALASYISVFSFLTAALIIYWLHILTKTEKRVY